MSGAPPVPAGSLLARHPWLLDANTWRLDWPGNVIAPHQAGVWPIGNGRVFAHAGLALPFNRLQGITGPTYQTEGDRRVEGAFGDWWIEIADHGRTLIPTGHRIWRPRQSGVLVTQTLLAGVTLTTVDFAPPDTATIVRLIELWGASRSDLTILLRFPAGQPRGSRLGATHRPGQSAVLAVLGAPAEARPGAIVIRLASGSDVSRFAAALFTAETAESAESTANAGGGGPSGEDLLERTRSLWAARVRGLKPRLGHLPLEAASVWEPVTAHPHDRSPADLVEAGYLTAVMQQSASGGIGPMVHYKGTWARDNNGPVRALLALGAFEEVAALLRYYHDAALVLGGLPNRAPLDLDVSAARPPADWERFTVPAAEVPSWFVLQHWWWVGGGGEPDLVRRHWPMLERCIQGQRISRDGLLPFHGDETYLHGALFGVADRCPPPNDLIAHRWGDPGPPWSLEATAAFATACTAMAEMAERAGMANGRMYQLEGQRVRAALEKAFWLDDLGHYAPALYGSSAAHLAPVAPINLALLWMGYARPGDPRAGRDLDTVVRLAGWRGATPRCDYDVGMTCGYLLHDLVATGSPLAERAFDEVLRRASPAGEWAEIYGPGGTPDAGYDRENPNRLRPWEGGITLEAILRSSPRQSD